MINKITDQQQNSHLFCQSRYIFWWTMHGCVSLLETLYVLYKGYIFMLKFQDWMICDALFSFVFIEYLYWACYIHWDKRKWDHHATVFSCLFCKLKKKNKTLKKNILTQGKKNPKTKKKLCVCRSWKTYYIV